MMPVGAIGRGTIADYVEAVFIVYFILIFIRILLTWVPRIPYNRTLRAVVGFIEEVTDPYLNLFRRVNSYDEAAARRAAASGPDDVDAQSKVADLDLANGRIEEAFDRLLGVVRRTSGEDRNKARLHLIGLFDIFPPRDPRVARARATLSSLLF